MCTVLKLFCPVRAFGLIFKGEEASLVALSTGTLFSAACGSFVIYAAKKELMTSLIMPGLVCTYSGLAFSLLGLANWRICYDERKNAKKLSFKTANAGPYLSEEDVSKALEYLAGHFRDVFEEKSQIENDVDRNAFIDVPLEFAYAFGSGLLKVLENRSIVRQRNAVDKSAWNATDIRALELNVLNLELFDQLKTELDKFEREAKQTKLGIVSQARMYSLYDSILNVILRFQEEYPITKKSSNALEDYARIPTKRIRESDVPEKISDVLSLTIGARKFIKPSLPSKSPIKAVHENSTPDNTDTAKNAAIEACIDEMMEKAAALNAGSPSQSRTKSVSPRFSSIKSLSHPSGSNSKNMSRPVDYQDYLMRRFAHDKQRGTSESKLAESNPPSEVRPVNHPPKKDSDSDTDYDSESETGEAKFFCESSGEDNGPPYLLEPEEEQAMKAKIMQQYECEIIPYFKH